MTLAKFSINSPRVVAFSSAARGVEGEKGRGGARRIDHIGNLGSDIVFMIEP